MAGILVGYARVSTADQDAGLEAQIRDLKAIGCEEIFTERVSAVAHRDQLQAALRFVRKGDTLAVTKLDRLARSTADLLKIITDLETRGVGLIVLSMGGRQIDTTSPTGKLLLVNLAAIAEFELGLLKERQREGIAKAKRDGRYTGRKPTARAKAADVLALDGQKVPRAEIARRCGISVASVYRIVGSASQQSSGTREGAALTVAR